MICLGIVMVLEMTVSTPQQEVLGERQSGSVMLKEEEVGDSHLVFNIIRSILWPITNNSSFPVAYKVNAIL